MKCFITDICLRCYKNNDYEIFCGLANSAEPDKRPHVVSDQGLHCLLIEFFINIKKNLRQNRPDTPKMTNGLVQ